MIQPFRAYIDRRSKTNDRYLRTKPTKEAQLTLGFKLAGAKEFAMFLLGTPPREPFAGRKKETVSK